MFQINVECSKGLTGCLRRTFNKLYQINLIKGVFVLCLQADLLGGRSFQQQYSWFWFRPFLPAQPRHDGRQHLLHLHGGGGGVRLQPPATAWGGAPRQTEVLGMIELISNQWPSCQAEIFLSTFYFLRLKYFWSTLFYKTYFFKNWNFLKAPGYCVTPPTWCITPPTPSVSFMSLHFFLHFQQKRFFCSFFVFVNHFVKCLLLI